MAIKHTTSSYKLQHSTSDNASLTKIYREKGWITSDETVLNLLKDGYENFQLKVASRIVEQSSEKVFFNNCPKCNKLARTPYARQCRYCGHSWHDLTIGQFKLNSSFQLPGRYFYLLGQITKGEIKEGNFIDLTMLGLSKKPKIETIEFALKKQDGNTWEDIALGTNELNEDDKTYLIKMGGFQTPFDIIKKP